MSLCGGLEDIKLAVGSVEVLIAPCGIPNDLQTCCILQHGSQALNTLILWVKVDALDSEVEQCDPERFVIRGEQIGNVFPEFECMCWQIPSAYLLLH